MPRGFQPATPRLNPGNSIRKGILRGGWVLALIAGSVGCGPGPAAEHSARPQATTNPPASLSPAADTNQWELDGAPAPLPSKAGNPKVAPLLEAAEALLQSNRLKEAADRLAGIIREFPDSEEAHFTLGFVLARMGRSEEAVQEYQATLRLVPEYAEAHNNLGNLLIKLKRPEEAIPHFEAVIRNDEKNSLAENNLGTALASLKRIQQAIPHFNRAVQLNGDYADAWFNLGGSYFQEGRFAEAILPLETALKLRPDLTIARRLLERARQQLSQPR